MSRVWSVSAFLLAVMVCAPAEAQVRRGSRAGRSVFTDKAVADAIDKAKEYLWSHYRPNGSPWFEGQRGTAKGKGPIHPPRPGTKLDARNCNYGGYTALTVYALLTAGESYQDPRMKRAIEWLANLDCKGTYSLGIRTQIWAQLPQDSARKLLARDADRLVKSICRPQGPPSRDPNQIARYGSYGYISDGSPSKGGCNSNSQFGVLGVWAAARRGIEIRRDYWQIVYNHWVNTQLPGGAWCYANGGLPNTMPEHLTPRQSLVPAGLASLFIAIDNLHARQFVYCNKKLKVPAIDRALKWLDANHGIDRANNYYYLYGIERVGLATGYKYFGKVDWYRAGAANLLRSQRPDGSWGGQFFSNSFALLFLARGRNPVMFNRLEYDGDWNNRPRALANLTRWVSLGAEREVNWQIVNLDSPVSEWHDSQMLLISGSAKVKFTDDALAKVGDFVRQGGTILSVAECGRMGRRFDLAMREHYAKMFPQYELKLLPADHPIYSIRFKLKRPIKVWGLSNGVRIVAFHTDTDMIVTWQLNKYKTARRMFELVANISFFANDKTLGRPRGASPWPERAPFAARRVVRVARVKHAGNWDPEPLAWRRFKRLMGRKWGIRVVVSQPMTFAQLDAGRWPIAAVTGTGQLALDRAEEDALRAYVQAGGKLLIDAAGGSKPFATSAAKLVEELFGEASMRRLLISDAVYNLPGMKIESVKYRRSMFGIVAGSTAPRLRAVDVGKKAAVFLSREDLTAGLLGGPVFGCVGYAPDSALEIVRNIVMYANGGGTPARRPRRAQ